MKVRYTLKTTVTTVTVTQIQPKQLILKDM